MIMLAPTIHLNGTNQTDLVDNALRVRLALAEVLEKLHDMAPNGRDYYPQGPAAITEALADYRSIHTRVTAIADEVERFALAIADGGRKTFQAGQE
jgi:hypothetical protein